MNVSFFKRALIILGITTSSVYAINSPILKNTQVNTKSIQTKLMQLESSFDGQIGVYAIDTNTNQIISYRGDQRFPFQSTMKLMGVAALLKYSENNKNLLQEKIHYTKADLMSWSPITSQHLATGMTLESMAEAAISYSDNPAMNLIMKKFGGPNFVTTFAHSIGNKSFNVKHYEGNLNSDSKNDDDTSTPKDMAISVQKLMVGNTVLTSVQQKQLTIWMVNNTTGYKRIRAGVPLGFVVADKTGSGDYGIANDIGIVWSPKCKPIVLAIYTIRNKFDATRREDIIASTTALILDDFAHNDKCFLN